MKTTANGQATVKANNFESIAMPMGEYGDLCYDYYGKGSVIVFGNTDDHREQLEQMGGKYSDRLRYSALQNGRKWTEKQGRTAGYYFTTEQGKEQAVKYVQRVNHSIFDKYEQEAAKMGDKVQRREDLKEGDRVRTIHGVGTVTAHEPKYNKRVSVCVKLDKFTYNYGWKGMPHTFIECRCDEVAVLQELSEIKADKPAPSSWATDYSADDFHKLTSRYEIADEDRDVLGNRYELKCEGLGVLQIFVSDYAGNERHALIYILDGFTGKVSANVLPIDKLRRILTTERGWHRLAA